MVSRARRDERVAADVVRLCHAGRDGAELLRSVVERLRLAVPYDFWCASTTDPSSCLMTTAMAAPALSAADGLATFERLYFEHYLEEARAMARARRSVALLTETAGGDLCRSPRWRELLHPAGLGDELRGAFTAGTGLWGTADLARAGDRGFTTGEVALVRRLAPHLGAGLRVAALRAKAESRSVTTLDEATPGVLVLDAIGQVVRSTLPAERLLADLETLRPGWREPDRVPLAVRMLVGLLRRTLRPDTDADADKLPRLRVRGRSGRWLTLHASLTEPAPARSPEVVVVVEPARGEDLVELGPQAYGLSPRERQIVSLIAQGASTAQIAAALHISEYTVQNHVSHAFEKVGVRDRHALTRRLFLDVLYPSLFG